MDDDYDTLVFSDPCWDTHSIRSVNSSKSEMRKNKKYKKFCAPRTGLSLFGLELLLELGNLSRSCLQTKFSFNVLVFLQHFENEKKTFDLVLIH